MVTILQIETYIFGYTWQLELLWPLTDKRLKCKTNYWQLKLLQIYEMVFLTKILDSKYDALCKMYHYLIFIKTYSL